MDPTVAELAGAVARSLAELGLERPHVAGNSLGGAVGLELALLGRPRMRRLLYGQMFAHPQRLAPGEALAQMDVLRAATASTRRCRT